LFIVATAVLALFVASPALQRLLVYPQADSFTELSLLGPGHTAENYPYDISRNENYTVFLGVANHLGSCAYYQVEVKFRNETQSAPNSFNRTPGNLISLYNIGEFVADKERLETSLNFAFDYTLQSVTRIVYTNVTISNGPGKNDTVEQRPINTTLLQMKFNNLRLNNNILNLQGYSSDWNPLTNEFYGNLIFELWIFNSTIGGFQYNERFVDLKLNITSTGTA
jgi:hypothetical protein